MDAEIHVAAREGDERDQNAEEAETEVWKCPHAEKNHAFLLFSAVCQEGHCVLLIPFNSPFQVWSDASSGRQGAKTVVKVILGQTKATERAKWNIFVKSKNAQDIQQQKSEHWVKMIWIAKTLAPTPFEWSDLIVSNKITFWYKVDQYLILSYFFNTTV